jgi:hypothetical protein
VDDDPLPPRTLVLTLPAMTVAQAQRLLETIDAISEALWAEYGEAVIDLTALRGPSEDDLADGDVDDELLPF